MGGRERLTSDVLPALNKTIMIWYCPDCGTGDPPLLHLPKSTIANVWGDISCARRIPSYLPWPGSLVISTQRSCLLSCQLSYCKGPTVPLL